MSESTHHSHVDTQVLSDTDTYVYETIATLEYAGREPSRTAIADAVNLDPQTLDQALAELTAHGVVIVSGSGEEPSYAPAKRGWSTRPDAAAGHRMS